MIRKGKTRKARPVMIQGTSSHVGKSVLAAALLRILKDRGLKVAPFKAQNMALNSFVTKEGGEIGVAQAFQASAAGVEPSIDFNPILLKPTGDSSAQVIIHGRVYADMSAVKYHGFKHIARRYVMESYRRLESLYDVIVIEGAGSPAEINLRQNDIANMGIARAADSPVILVGDIDRGGVFASLVGTLSLLTRAERERIKGFIINKFRGDLGLLKPGIDFLRERTARPTLGVIPYFKDTALPSEDSVSLEGSPGTEGKGRVKIKVVRLPRISNFTDFDPFMAEPSLSVDFIVDPDKVRGASLLIIPGSKNTLEDLAWLKRKGFDTAIKRFYAGGGMVAGICGGFQMLGKSVKDPHNVESRKRHEKGLCLLDAETVLKKDKKTFQVRAEAVNGGVVKGYEIHMGETKTSARPFARVVERGNTRVDVEDGAISEDGMVWGTYMHGIFENDRFRSGLLRALGGNGKDTSFAKSKDAALASLAALVEENMDMKRVYGIIGA